MGQKISIVCLSLTTSHHHTQYGETALHLAAQKGKVDVVRLLTEAGAQLNIQAEV